MLPTGVLASPEMSGIGRVDSSFSRMGIPTVQTGIGTRACLLEFTTTAAACYSSLLQQHATAACYSSMLQCLLLMIIFGIMKANYLSKAHVRGKKHGDVFTL